jgi:hypothetical protein
VGLDTSSREEGATQSVASSNLERREIMGLLTQDTYSLVHQCLAANSHQNMQDSRKPNTSRASQIHQCRAAETLRTLQLDLRPHHWSCLEAFGLYSYYNAGADEALHFEIILGFAFTYLSLYHVPRQQFLLRIHISFCCVASVDC